MKHWIAYAALAALGVALMRKAGIGAYTSATVQRIARAVAVAEGYMRSDGTILTANKSARCNNPGSIMTPEWTMIQYPTPDAGWAALYRQIDLMLSGRSAYYKPTMTISQIAKTYTGEAKYMEWAVNVARELGVSTETQIGSVV